MKDYYLFASSGNAVQIQCDEDNFTFILKDDIESNISQLDGTITIKQNRIRSTFKKEELINQLEKFLSYVKK